MNNKLLLNYLIDYMLFISCAFLISSSFKNESISYILPMRKESAQIKDTQLILFCCVGSNSLKGVVNLKPFA